MAERKKGINTAEFVRSLAQPVAGELGLSLWDVVFVKEGADWFLRIFIDKVGGVGIEDCVDMTKAINPLIDAEDPIPQEYTLEVSSCGLNRLLTKKEHFLAFLDAPVKVKLIRPLPDGKREVEGILVDVQDNGDFELCVGEDTTALFQKKECVNVMVLDDDFELPEEE